MTDEIKTNNLPDERYIFISYSSKDQEAVERLVKLLNDIHVPWWKAPEMIPTGSSYAHEIVNAIEHCGIFLLLFSTNSQQSMWVEKELDCALSYHRHVLPYNLDGAILRDSFKFYLNNVQMIFHTPDSRRSTKELMEALRPYIALTPSGRAEPQPEVRNSRLDLHKKTTTLRQQRIAESFFADRQSSAANTQTSAASRPDISSRSLADPSARQDISSRTLADPSARQDISSRTLADPVARQDISSRTLADPSARQDISSRSLAEPSGRQDISSRSLADSAGRQDISSRSLADPSGRRDGFEPSAGAPTHKQESFSRSIGGPLHRQNLQTRSSGSTSYRNNSFARQTGSVPRRQDIYPRQAESAPQWQDGSSQALSAPQWQDGSSQALSAPQWQDGSSQALSAPQWQDGSSQALSSPQWRDGSSQALSAPQWQDGSSQALSAPQRQDGSSQALSAPQRQDGSSQALSAPQRQDGSSQAIHPPAGNPPSSPQTSTPEKGSAALSPGKKEIIEQKRRVLHSLNSPNRIPVNCLYCGGSVNKRQEGIYICEQCGKENYDDYQTIRNYIRENGPASISELEARLKIPRRIISSWRDSENSPSKKRNLWN